jgi:hypothetical protein
MSIHVNSQLLQVLIMLLGLQKCPQLLSYRGAQHIKGFPNVNSMGSCRTDPNMPNIRRCPTYQGAQLLRFQCINNLELNTELDFCKCKGKCVQKCLCKIKNRVCNNSCLCKKNLCKNNVCK